MLIAVIVAAVIRRRRAASAQLEHQQLARAPPNLKLHLLLT